MRAGHWLSTPVEEIRDVAIEYSGAAEVAWLGGGAPPSTDAGGSVKSPRLLGGLLCWSPERDIG